MAKRTEELDFNDWTSTGRKTNQIMNALDEVQQFHELDSNMQVKQFLTENKRLLSTMILLNNVQESTMGIIDLVSDLSYAWNIIDRFFDRIKDNVFRFSFLFSALQVLCKKESNKIRRW